MTLGAELSVVVVGRESRCGCGEPLLPGEQAGLLVATDELLCLWCLADVSAGRRRTSHRRSPVVLVPPQSATVTPLRPRRRTRGHSAWGSAAVAGLIVLAVLAVVAWPRTGWGAAAAGSSEAYAFMATLPDGRTPVRFPACRTIPVVVNKAQAPARADAMLEEALDAVSRATGLQFVIEGETDEVPTADRRPRDVTRYGNRWSPALVAWTDPATVPDLADDVAGVGGPRSAPSPLQDQHYVSGIVYLDGPTFSDMMRSHPDGYRQGKAIVMHEVAHMVGLTHVDDPNQLMAPKGSTVVDFQAGDLEGLRRLGDGPCYS